MLKHLFSSALTALLLAALLISGCVVFERTSSTEYRVELFGSAFKLDTSCAIEFIEKIFSGMKIWSNAIPDSLNLLFCDIKHGLSEMLSNYFDNSYTPSCRLC